MWYTEEKEMVYLDYNTTAEMSNLVEGAIIESVKYWGSPCSLNPLGVEMGRKYAQSHAYLLEVLGVSEQISRSLLLNPTPPSFPSAVFINKWGGERGTGRMTSASQSKIALT
ncbi:unnamed protein product [Toxocara canis]|uniref:Alpha-galactosidase n=1 Tax=Toxocara canis TaxID=6265 RepID=A0A183UU09_TOXCA|nr:unnamed protein product [Toxocara canis]